MKLILLLNISFRWSLFSCFFLITLSYSAQNNSKTLTSYTPDGLIHFRISKKEILVKFNVQAQESEILSFLGNQPEIRQAKKDDILPAPKNLVFLTLTDELENPELNVLLNRLELEPSIEYAQMILIHEDGTMQGISNQVIIKLKSASEYSTLDSIIASNGLRLKEIYKNDPLVHIVEIPKNTVQPLEFSNQLTESGLFEWVEVDFFRFMKMLSTNDPLVDLQWSLNNTGSSIQYNGTPSSGMIGADLSVFNAWNISTGSPNIKVAIIDAGVDLEHPDLIGNILQGYDAAGLNSGGAPFPYDAHGTSCAGIVAASGNNNIGITGIAFNSKIVPIRLGYTFSQNTNALMTSSTWIGASIDWAWDNGQADVLSNSWGGGSSSNLINDAINRALTLGRNGLGCSVLFAAGNSNSNVIYPASLQQVIAVGAMSMCNQRKSLTSCDLEQWGSCFGPNLDVLAPGVKIYTTDNIGAAGYVSGNYNPNFNGTSSACPNAAGVMALILSVNPALNQLEARAVLETTCDKIGGYPYWNAEPVQPNGSWTFEAGYGKLNAFSALQLAASAPCDSVLLQASVQSNLNYICNPNGDFGNIWITDLNYCLDQTYQWQISVDNLSWVSLNNQTFATLSTFILPNTWYRCVITRNGISVPTTSLQLPDNIQALNLPYTETLNNISQIPCNWTNEDVNNDGTIWQLSSNISPTNKQLIYSNQNTAQADDWIISPGLNLQAGLVYRVNFKLATSTAQQPQSLVIKWGQSPSSSEFFETPIYLNNSIVNTTLNETFSTTLIPQTSGVYYIGFGVINPNHIGSLILDDIVFEESSISTCSSPPNDAIAVISNSAVCENDDVFVSLLNYNLAENLLYQWQFSLNNVDWNNLNGAMLPLLETTGTQSGWYRCNLTCNGQSFPSTSVAVDVYPEVIVNIPFTENFDVRPQIPCGWTVQDLNNDLSTWQIISNSSNSAPRSINHSIPFSSVNPSNDWLFTPPIQLIAGTQYRVRFKSQIRNSIAARLEIKFGTQPSEQNMYQDVLFSQFFTSSLPVFSSYATITFSPETSGTFYIGFKSFGIAGSSLVMDDIIIEMNNIGNCELPTETVNISTSNPSVCGEGTVHLSLQNISFTGNQTYQWQTSDDNQNWTDIPGLIFFDVSIFTSSNKWFRCKINCSGTELLTSSIKITDGSLIENYPYFENFNSSASLPCGWTNLDANQDNNTWEIRETSPISRQVASSVSSNLSSQDDWLFSPGLYLTGGKNYRVSFLIGNINSGSIFHSDLNLKWGTSTNPAELFEVPLYSIRSVNLTGAPSQMRRDTAFAISPPTSGVYYLAFNIFNSLSGFRMFIDDVRIDEIGSTSCQNILNNANAKALPNQVCGQGYFNASLSNISFSESYSYQWQKSTDNQNWENIASANFLTCTIYAAQSSFYRCQIFCGSQFSYSNSVFVEATSETIQNIPFTETFNAKAEIPCGWSIDNVNSDIYTWTVLESQGMNQTNGISYLPFNSNSSMPPNDWFFTKGIQIQAGTKCRVKFWFLPTFHGHELTVKWGTGQNVESMYHQPLRIVNNASSNNFSEIISGEFTPEETGTYFIGTHLTSTSPSISARIDDFSVEIGGTQACSVVTPLISAAQTFVCDTGTVTFSQTNYNFFMNYQYQWQYSYDNSNWLNIQGAISNILNRAIDSTQWIRLNLICGNTTSTSAPVLIHHRNSSIQNLPYFEDFSAFSSLSCGWTQENTNLDNNIWQILNNQLNNKNASVFTNQNSDDWLFSPAINMIAGEQYRVKFKYQVTENNTAQKLELKWGNEQTSISMSSNPLFIHSNITNTSFQEAISSAINPVISGTYYLGFHVFSNFMGRLSIDDVLIEKITADTCILPNTQISIQAQPQTICEAGQIVLNLIEIPGASNYFYQWQKSSDQQNWVNLIGQTFNSATIYASNDSWYRCLIKCGEDFVISSPIFVPVSNTIISYPHTENFDNSNELPCGWTFQNYNNDETFWGVSNANSNSFPFCIFYRSHSTNITGDDWLFSPGLYMEEGSSYRIRLKMRFTTEDGSSQGKRQKISINWGTGPSDEQMFDPPIYFDENFNSSQYIDVASRSVIPNQSGVYYFGFHNYSNAFNNSLRIDNISIEKSSTQACIQPPSTIQTVTFPNRLVCDIDTINLTLSNFDFSGSYTYQWQESIDNSNWIDMDGFTLPDGSVVVNQTKWFRCEIRCGDLFSYSIPIQIFRQPNSVTTLPYIENFDHSYSSPCNWTFESPDQNRSWITNTVSAFSMPHSLCNPTTFQNNPSNSWAFTPGIYLNAGETYRLRFNYSRGAAVPQNVARLEVKWGTSANSASMYEFPLYFNNSINNTSFLEATTIPFSPAESGFYHIGFKDFTSNQNTLSYIDNIIVENNWQEDCLLPLPSLSASASKSVTCLNEQISLLLNEPSLFNYNYDYQWQYSIDNISWNDMSGFASVHVMPTITQDTWFRCKVSCGLDSILSNSVFVGMLQDINTSYPYIQNFDEFTGLPCGWTIDNLENTIGDWNNILSAQSGNRTLSYSANVNVNLIENFSSKSLYTSGMFFEAGKTYRVRFSSITSNSGLDINWGSSPSQTGMNLGNIFYSTSPNSQSLNGELSTLSFSPTTSGIYYIGFRPFRINNSTISMVIDNVVIEELIDSPCTIINNDVAAIAITDHVCENGNIGLTLINAPFNSSYSYQWQYSQDNTHWYDSPNQNTFSINENLEGVKWFRSKIICNSDTITSTSVRTFSYENISNFPFLETFERIQNLNCGWSTIDVNDGANWKLNIFNTFSGRVAEYQNSANGEQDWLLSPKFQFEQGQTVRLRFWAFIPQIANFDLISIKYGNLPQINVLQNTLNVYPTGTNTGNFSELVSEPIFIQASSDFYFALSFQNTFSITTLRINDFSVEVMGIQNCIDFTQSINTVSAPAVICQSTPFNLFLSQLDFTGNYAYQWQKSPDNMNWVDLDGQNSFYASDQTNSPFWYRCMVSCGDSTLASTPRLINPVSNEVANFPYNENFNASVNLPCGWTVNDMNNDQVSWQGLLTNVSNNPISVAYLASSANQPADDWLVSPPFYFDAGKKYRLSFNYRTNNNNGAQKLEVRLGNLPFLYDNGTSQIFLHSNINNTNFVTAICNEIVIVQSGFYAVGFKVSTDSNINSLLIDNISIVEITTDICNLPSSPPTTVVSPTYNCVDGTVMLMVSNLNLTNNFEFQWQRSEDNIIWENISGSIEISALVNLEANTWFRCMVSCGSFSIPSSPLRVIYNTGIINDFPYYENFDQTLALPCGWSFQNVDNDDTRFFMSSFSSLSTPNNVILSASTNNQANDWIFTPALSLSANASYRVRFYPKSSSIRNYHKIEIKYGNSPNADDMNSDAIYSNMYYSTGSYTLQLSDIFSPPVDGLYHIGFRLFTDNVGFGLNIDDITIEMISNCTEPTIAGIISGPDEFTAGQYTSFNYTGGNAVWIDWELSINDGPFESLIASNPNLLLNLNPGNYKIRARTSKSACSDDYTNVLSFNVQPTIGDNISIPIIVEDLTLPINGSNASGSGYTSAYNGIEAQNSPDIYYQINTGNCVDTLQISTCQSDFSTILHLLDEDGNHLISNNGNGPICTDSRASLIYPVTQNTTYFVVIEGSGNTTGNFTLDINSISLYDLSASVTSSGALSFCQGDSVVLSATNAASYLWSNGATTQNITVTQAGQYSVQITDANSCVAITDPLAVQVFNNPISEITINGTTTFCQGDSVVLSATNAVSYLWSNGATTQNITVTQAGQYSVQTTDANSCISEPAILQIHVLPIPIVSISSLDTLNLNDAPITIEATPSGGNFTGAGVSGNIFTPSIAGIGLHIVYYNYTDENGCTNIDSIFILVQDPCEISAGQINGPESICEYLWPDGNLATYSISSHQDVNQFIWGLPDGAILISEPNNPSISFYYSEIINPSLITLTLVGCGDTLSRSKEVFGLVPDPPNSVTGPTTEICQGSVQEYSVTQSVNANNFNWEIPSSWTLNSGQGTNTIEVMVGAESGMINVKAVNQCGESLPKELIVTTMDCEVSVEKISPELINVLPNPFSNFITVNIGQITNEVLNFQIFDSSGRLVFSESCKGNQSIILYPTLSSGFYFLSVNNRNGNIQKFKLLKVQTFE